MDLALLIYLIDRADLVFNGVPVAFAFLSVAGYITGGLIYCLAGGEEAVASYDRNHERGVPISSDEGFAKFFSLLPHRGIKLLTIPIIVGHLLVPDKDLAYTMLAAYGVQTAVESPEVKAMAGKSLEVLEKAMDDYLSTPDT